MTKLSLTVGQLSSNKEVQTVATLASSIAHEVKNYLSAINICAELSEKQLINIRNKILTANYLIDNLQLQIRGVVAREPVTKNFKHYSIAKNIEEILDQYPFKKGERELIKLDLEQDFVYKGGFILTSHILFNLIKNALRAIENAGKGTITIKLKSEKNYNKLVFADTATGVDKNFLSKMFTLFESQKTAQGGTGVGLAFCKTIMNSYGGDISCDSVEGEYTKFTLTFPPRY
jgi:signal transduction histidine kinase